MLTVSLLRLSTTFNDDYTEIRLSPIQQTGIVSVFIAGIFEEPTNLVIVMFIK